MTYDDVSHAKNGGEYLSTGRIGRHAKQQKLENVGCKTGTFKKGWNLLVLR